MSTQTVKFEYDPARNILFTEDDYTIATEQDADTFLDLYRKELLKIGKKIWLVTRIDGLELQVKVYDYYGAKLKEFADKWYLGYGRWGTRAVSRMTVRASSLRAKFDINIYPPKETALAAVEKMMQGIKPAPC